MNKNTLTTQSMRRSLSAMIFCVLSFLVGGGCITSEAIKIPPPKEGDMLGGWIGFVSDSDFVRLTFEPGGVGKCIYMSSASHWLPEARVVQDWKIKNRTLFVRAAERQRSAGKPAFDLIFEGRASSGPVMKLVVREANRRAATSRPWSSAVILYRESWLLSMLGESECALLKMDSGHTIITPEQIEEWKTRVPTTSHPFRKHDPFRFIQGFKDGYASNAAGIALTDGPESVDRRHGEEEHDFVRGWYGGWVKAKIVRLSANNADTEKSAISITGAQYFELTPTQLDENLRMASDSNANAAFRLYQHYAFGVADETTGACWLRKAADLGHKQAKQHLDVEAATEKFRKADGGTGAPAKDPFE
jgi:hypothetical protein